MNKVFFVVVILCATVMAVLTGCTMEENYDWQQSYEAISYEEYMSEDYPYVRSLLRIEGKVASVEEQTVIMDGEPVTGYLVVVEPVDGTGAWQCSYYTSNNRASYRKYPYIPVILEPLNEGEQIVVYGHHDKKTDMDEAGEPVVDVVRLDYQGILYQAIDRHGFFAFTSHDSVPVEYPPQEPMGFTYEKYIEQYNRLAEEYDVSPIDKDSEISMNYSKRIRTYWIPNDRIERFKAKWLFTVSFAIDETSNLVESLEAEFSGGFSTWDEMQNFNKEIAKKGLAIAIMAADPQLSLEEAKEIVERTQTKEGENWENPVLLHDLWIVGWPYENRHGITIRAQQIRSDT